MKNIQNRSISLGRIPTTLVGVTLSVLLAACGGGGGAVASLPTGAVQLASGTVTGFGSVYVDGIKIEDATASVRRENRDGSFSNVALKLGHRVRVEHDGLTASSVNVDAAVIGLVSAVDTANNTLTVAGQLVKVNADSTTSIMPVTVYGGINTAGVSYTALTDVSANDLVQVYGSAVYNSAVYELQATRIEAQSTNTGTSVMGTVSNIDTTAKTFKINGLQVNYSAATVVPMASTLTNDQPVVVWGSSLSNTSGTPTLTASRVRLTRASLGTVALGKTQLSGLVSKYDAFAKTLEIDGIIINVASATVTPVVNTLADNSFVDIKGSFNSTGVVVATTVRIRQQNTGTDTARINLGGVISSFVDSTSFVVRGVPVDASMATTRCVLADGVYVDVVAKAQAGTAVVLASTVNCLPAPSTFSMRESEGTASMVNQTAQTFTLIHDGRTQTVLWSDQTVFTGITAANLATTAKLKVVGYINSSNVLVARDIHLDGQDDHDAFTSLSLDDDKTGWGKYKTKKSHND